MIIEFVRRSSPVVVDMAGSPPIVIERASEVAMKVYLKAEEMGKHIQTSLEKPLYFDPFGQTGLLTLAII